MGGHYRLFCHSPLSIRPISPLFFRKGFTERENEKGRGEKGIGDEGRGRITRQLQVWHLPTTPTTPTLPTPVAAGRAMAATSEAAAAAAATRRKKQPRVTTLLSLLFFNQTFSLFLYVFFFSFFPFFKQNTGKLLDTAHPVSQPYQSVPVPVPVHTVSVRVR